jgi:hypothetical protein
MAFQYYYRTGQMHFRARNISPDERQKFAQLVEGARCADCTSSLSPFPQSRQFRSVASVLDNQLISGSRNALFQEY